MARFANNVERKTLANILADMAVVCDSEMRVVIAATVCICTAHLSGNMRELPENSCADSERCQNSPSLTMAPYRGGEG